MVRVLGSVVVLWALLAGVAGVAAAVGAVCLAASLACCLLHRAKRCKARRHSFVTACKPTRSCPALGTG